MVEYLKQELPSAFFGALVGAALSLLVCLTRAGYKRWKMRSCRKFWRPFTNGPLTIAFTEYSPIEIRRFADIANRLGARWLLSRSMAFSLKTLLSLSEKRFLTEKTIEVVGDKSGSLPESARNLIILGTPDVNNFAKAIYAKIEEMYEMPYKIEWDRENSKWCIVGENMSLSPEIQNNNGDDYALVIKACYQKDPEKWVLMIFGCQMWGTEAASSAVTDASVLNSVTGLSNSASNIAFVIKTRVLNNVSCGPELDIKGQRHVRVLQQKSR